MFIRYKNFFLSDQINSEGNRCLQLHNFWATASQMIFYPQFNVAPSLILDFYKQCFVISTQALEDFSINFTDNRFEYFVFWFFSAASQWYRYVYLDVRWEFEKRLGLVWSVKEFLIETLRHRRSFLLHFGQRRVCARATVWALPGFFAQIKFDSEPYSVEAQMFCFSYKHLHRSAYYPVGVLLNQPNFHLFIQFLSNPYFWTIMQQTLHSNYRY